jgi:lipopolysaccharide transport system ATP-binding protein
VLADEPDSVDRPIGESQVGLRAILDDASTSDVCHTRQSYNKNEVRFGNGAARIIDYTIQSEGVCDVSNIRFGSRVALYLKVLFCRNVHDPIIGFSVKTLEGVEIFGTNTFLMGEKVDPGIQGEVRVFSFLFSLRINPNDYFFDLGVAEADGTRGGTVLDVRRSVAHCVVTFEKQRSFEGLVDLMPSFEVLNELGFCDHVNTGAEQS